VLVRTLQSAVCGGHGAWLLLGGAAAHLTHSAQVYHSAVPSEGEPHACGFALLPLNTKTRGPAKRTEGALQHNTQNPSLSLTLLLARARRGRH